ncbi:DMT family transporter [Jeongeupia naejangsanensis]|uniref:DMT family transporter n=1 Tax=Jeongeupia naejangsanensis TaxID=613195 RepID=A0ABS2BK84_9NEIS|nr:DMT family transporter [Jeongeupia naejangsanensis]MBM3115840.1 DMT family transporter [Jeongeupia naejangsanensis]
MSAILSRTPWLAEAMLLLVALLWGTSYGVAKGALVYYPVLGFLAVRFGLTFLLLLPSLRQLATPAGRAALGAGLPLGAILLGIFICETFGIALTTAANAAFLISLCVVFTPFAEWIMLGRRPDRTAMLAAGVSLAGAAMLSSGATLRFNLGDALMLVAAVLRAINVCMIKRLTQDRAMPMLTLTAVQAGVVCSGSVAVALLVSGTGLPALPTAPAFWIASLYLVLFCTIFAFFAQNWAVRRGSPSRVALLMGSEPVFGALFAAVWLGERLTPLAWCGAVLIVGACLWATLPRQTAAVA